MVALKGGERGEEKDAREQRGRSEVLAALRSRGGAAPVGLAGAGKVPRPRPLDPPPGRKKEG